MLERSNLTPAMQKRLEEWRANVQPVKSADLYRQSPSNFVPRRGDYGDDISDFEIKQNNLWAKEETYGEKR